MTKCRNCGHRIYKLEGEWLHLRSAYYNVKDTLRDKKNKMYAHDARIVCLGKECRVGRENPPCNCEKPKPQEEQGGKE